MGSLSLAELLEQADDDDDRRQDEGARRARGAARASARSRPAARWRRSASPRPAACGASASSSAPSCSTPSVDAERCSSRSPASRARARRTVASCGRRCARRPAPRRRHASWTTPCAGRRARDATVRAAEFERRIAEGDLERSTSSSTGASAAGARAGDVVLESRLAGWIATQRGPAPPAPGRGSPATEDERARRVAARDGADAERRPGGQPRPARRPRPAATRPTTASTWRDLSIYDLVLDSHLERQPDASWSAAILAGRASR